MSFMDSGKQYVTVPSFTAGGAMSFAFWVQSSASAQYARAFDFASGFLTSDNIGFQPWNTGDFYVCVLTTCTHNVNILSTGLNDGVWRHFVFTIDTSGNLKVYINGAYTQTFTGCLIPSTVLRNVNEIGYDTYNAEPSFNGALDEFYMFTTVLTAQQITNLYNQGEIS